MRLLCRKPLRHPPRPRRMRQAQTRRRPARNSQAPALRSFLSRPRRPTISAPPSPQSRGSFLPRHHYPPRSLITTGHLSLTHPHRQSHLPRSSPTPCSRLRSTSMIRFSPCSTCGLRLFLPPLLKITSIPPFPSLSFLSRFVVYITSFRTFFCLECLEGGRSIERCGGYPWSLWARQILLRITSCCWSLPALALKGLAS